MALVNLCKRKFSGDTCNQSESQEWFWKWTGTRLIPGFEKQDVGTQDGGGLISVWIGSPLNFFSFIVFFDQDSDSKNVEINWFIWSNMPYTWLGGE